MSSTTVSSKPDHTVNASRVALRESVVFPLVRETTGIIIEAATTSAAAPDILRFDGGDAYEAYFSNIDETAPTPPVKAPEEPAEIAIWLFGPEREMSPSNVYRALTEAIAPNGTIFVASEVPWPGKILAGDERGEYTLEETEAMLIRAGFYDVESIIEGPFFRITRAKKSTSNAYRALIEAEAHLDAGEPARAEQALNSLTEQLDSAAMVREYAMLIAACHDLAGRHEQTLEALSEALTLDPRCARAMCGLGRIAAIKGDLSTANDFFQSALRCEPALVAGHHGMAIIQEAEGKLMDAYQSMITASDLRPKNEALLSEAARIGNAIGELNDVAHFIAHRLDKSTASATYGNDAEGPGNPVAQS
jgi:tetratricopeptide (TPR) repeat protein